MINTERTPDMIPEFSLEYIGSTPYLVPYGQAVSCGAKAVKLNPTGAVMWEKLCDAISSCSGDICFNPMSVDLRNVWLDLLYNYFEADNGNDKSIIADDADTFIQTLCNSHVFNTFMFNNTINIDSVTKQFSIAGLSMSYNGPSRMYPADFDSFAIPANSKCDITISVAGSLSRNYPLEELVIETRDVCIFKKEDGYFILFNIFSVIKECELYNDGRVNLFYNIPSLKESGKCIHGVLNDIDYTTGTYEVFHAIRFAYLFFNQNRGIYALHSASILYRDRLWLISAPSGTGKSTHAGIWNKVYGIPVINGDLNCIDVSKLPLIVKGTPWCGTSGIYDNKTYRLGGIILISQGKENIVTPAERMDNVILSAANRLISPSWTKDMLKSNINAAKIICDNALIFSYSCDMSDNAAVVCREYIDRYMDNL